MAKKKKKKQNYQAPKQNKPPVAPKAPDPVEDDIAASASSEPAATSASSAPKAKKAAPEPAPRRRMPQMSPAMTISLFVVGLVGLVYIATNVFGPDDSGVVEADAWDLPALDAANDPDGDGRVTLAEFEGKPLVVNFFASWCTNCENELPRFVAAEDAHGDEVAFVYVNSNETGDWKPMADRTGIRDRLLVRDIKRRGSGYHRSLGGTGSMPMTAFYDASGNLVTVDNGEISASQLDERLRQLGIDV